jgi:hypothetical protein
LDLDLDCLESDFRNQITVPVKKDDEIKKEIKEYKNWNKLQAMITSNMGKEFLEPYKVILATIVSIWYANTESIYLIVLADPGSGKSTLCELFKYTPEIVSVDEATMNAFAAGIANEDSESHSLLDDASNRTLMIHDLTSSFSDDPKKIMKMKGVLENIFGKDGYMKYSPGGGMRKHGSRLNVIFGVTPYYFWQTYPHTKKRMGLDLVATERYIYLTIPDRNHFHDYLHREVITTRKIEVLAEKTAGYIQYLKGKVKRYELSDEEKETNADYIGRYFKYLKRMERKKNWRSRHGTETRRLKQSEQFCKAMRLIEGTEKIQDEMFETFEKALHLPKIKDEMDELDVEENVKEFKEETDEETINTRYIEYD